MTWQSEFLAWIDKQEKDGLSTNKLMNMMILEVLKTLKKSVSEGKSFNDIYNYINGQREFFRDGQTKGAKLASHAFKLAHDKMWSLRKYNKAGEQSGVEN